MIDPRHRVLRRDHTVLVIDPDPQNRDIAATILRFAGFRVVEAGEAEVGVRMALEAEPSVIVTELFERTELGWHILESFAGEEKTARIPVIVFSAYALPADREAAVRAGVARYLSKPLPPQELESTVDELLGIVEELEPPSPAHPDTHLEGKDSVQGDGE